MASSQSNALSGGAPLAASFSNIGVADRAQVGGKGASLGEMARAGIRVPDGFVITTAAFEGFMSGIDAEGRIRGSIEALAADDLIAISRAAELARERIVSAPMPENISAVIRSGYAALCGAGGELPVAVRSSATAEDSSDASFAGLQETYLWVVGVEAVLRAVRDCWASLYSAESVSYRLRFHLPEQGLAMGVVVQCMVNPRCSGVMFTRSPLTGDRSVIAIESSWGLGSAVVSGVVTPDKYIVNKVTSEIVKRTVSHKTVAHVPDPAGDGVREIAVADDRRDVACLEEAELSELVRLGLRIEGHYGCPQDIEWALAPDVRGVERLFVLQSRPETIWANRKPEAAAAPKATAFAHVFDMFGGKTDRKPVP